MSDLAEMAAMKGFREHKLLMAEQARLGNTPFKPTLKGMPVPDQRARLQTKMPMGQAISPQQPPHQTQQKNVGIFNRGNATPYIGAAPTVQPNRNLFGRMFGK